MRYYRNNIYLRIALLRSHSTLHIMLPPLRNAEMLFLASENAGRWQEARKRKVF